MKAYIMNNITLKNLDEPLKKRLEQRAIAHGHTVEEEIKLILQTAIPPSPTPPKNLTAAIEQRFAHLEDFELPKIKREPMRNLPQFEDEES